MSKNEEPATWCPDGSAGKPGSADTPAHLGAIPREIDQDVERAFDLMGDYQGFLRISQSSPTVPEYNRALDQLEQVLRVWMPRAAPANDPVLGAITIGDREAAARALAGVDLWPARERCLRSLADKVIPRTLDIVSSIAICRKEIRRWSDLLPRFTRGTNGQRCILQSDWRVAGRVGLYWSGNLESRPSRLGASLFLAAACRAVATAAHREGIPTTKLRPLLSLELSLSQSPDWRRIDASDIIIVLDEQLALIRNAQELLAEIELVQSDGHGDLTGVTTHDSSSAVSEIQLSSEEAVALRDVTGVEESFVNTAPSKEDPPCFFRDGDGWTVEFEGRRTVVQNLIGMLYIQRLLMKAGVPIPATELDGLDPGMASSEQPIVDDDELRAIGDRLSAIEEELSERKSPLTGEERDALAREKADLVDQVRASASHGHRRAMHSPQGKAHERVRGAIRRALNAIRQHHEPLWHHLGDALIGPGGANPCYRPASPITWRVNA